MCKERRGEKGPTHHQYWPFVLSGGYKRGHHRLLHWASTSDSGVILGAHRVTVFCRGDSCRLSGFCQRLLSFNLLTLSPRSVNWKSFCSHLFGPSVPLQRHCWHFRYWWILLVCINLSPSKLSHSEILKTISQICFVFSFWEVCSLIKKK